MLTTNTGSTTTYADAEHDHSVDNFTSGGTTPGDDVNYNDIDRSKGEQINTISYTEQQSGGSEGASDSRDDTQKATDIDVGEDDQGTGGETDVGTATDTDHDTDTDNSNVHSNTPQQTINDQATTGDIYDDHLTDNYNDAGGGETDDDTFHVEDRPYGSHNDQTTNVLPSDPNVNSGTSDVGSGGEDDVDDGEADETDNFNDQGHSQDTTKSNAASDQGAVPSNVQNVPWLIPPVLLPWPNNPTPFGSIMAASFSGPTTTSSANSSDTGTDKAHANGTTTDTNGADSTNESFGDTATDQFTDGFSQTSSGAYNGASGSGNFSMVVTNGDKGGETDTDTGTADGGVTSDTYNDVGGSSITQKTTMSENATSSGQDTQSSGRAISPRSRRRQSPPTPPAATPLRPAA